MVFPVTDTTRQLATYQRISPFLSCICLEDDVLPHLVPHHPQRPVSENYVPYQPEQMRVCDPGDSTSHHPHQPNPVIQYQMPLNDMVGRLSLSRCSSTTSYPMNTLDKD